MEFYTVKDIAEMLSVNEETVRRWIRDGKLDAERGNGRQGSKVNDISLKKFLIENKGLMTSGAVATLGLGTVGAIGAAVVSPIAGILATPIIGGAFVGASLLKKIKSKNQDKQTVKIELMEEEYKLEQQKAQLNTEIYRLQSEVKLIDSQINKIKEVIRDIENEVSTK